MPVEIDGKPFGGGGFYFADFHGDHVECDLGDADPRHRFKAHEVAWYDNGLELPPPEAKVYGRAGAEGGTPDA